MWPIFTTRHRCLMSEVLFGVDDRGLVGTVMKLVSRGTNISTMVKIFIIIIHGYLLKS